MGDALGAPLGLADGLAEGLIVGEDDGCEMGSIAKRYTFSWVIYKLQHELIILVYALSQTSLTIKLGETVGSCVMEGEAEGSSVGETEGAAVGFALVVGAIDGEAVG